MPALFSRSFILRSDSIASNMRDFSSRPSAVRSFTCCRSWKKKSMSMHRDRHRGEQNVEEMQTVTVIRRQVEEKRLHKLSTSVVQIVSTNMEQHQTLSNKKQHTAWKTQYKMDTSDMGQQQSLYNVMLITRTGIIPSLQ